MRNFTLILLACLVSAIAWSQKKDETAIKYANTVTKEDLKKHLTVIAADDMEGRDTGSPGQKKPPNILLIISRSWGWNLP